MANQQKSNNIIRVLETLWSKPHSSRADIARNIKVDRSTVGAVAELLLKKNFVYEQTESEPDGSSGRPPVLLQLNPKLAYTLGIELAKDSLYLTATSFSGEILYEQTNNKAFSLSELPQRVIETAQEAVESMEHKTLLGPMGTMIGVSGIVDSERGSILASNDLGIRREYVLTEEIEEALKIPVWIQNDADSGSLGELYYGNAFLQDFLYVLVKNKIDAPNPAINAGLGIILDGNLREAHSGKGREFRSPLISSDSPSQFLAADRLRKGEITREKAWIDFTDELSLSLAFLVHALDIEYIVLSGDAAGADFDAIAERINHHVSHNTSIFERVPIIISRPSCCTRSVAYGATAAAARMLFAERKQLMEKIGV